MEIHISAGGENRTDGLHTPNGQYAYSTAKRTH
jgi:hypothetical protein